MKKINKILFTIFIIFCSCEKKDKKEILIHLKNVEVDLIGKFKEEEASKIAQDRIGILSTSLEPNYDPYSGKENIPALCQKTNLPEAKTVKNKNGFSYRLSFFSSEQKVLGVCADENQIVKTEYEILFCRKSNSLYVAKFFYEKKSPWFTEPLVSCAP